MQPWYADDAVIMGKAPAVASCFKKVIEVGPHFGYHLEPAKSFIICHLADEADAKAVFDEKELPVKFCRGHGYVSRFIGLAAMKDWWIETMVEKWVAGINALFKVVVKYPQTAYAGFTQSLQAE